MAYGAAFPEKSDAPQIAKRMAQLEINVVRFHHMDSRDIWGTIWGNIRNNNKNSILDTNQFDKLHFFYFVKKIMEYM